jgi:hypothetical protein
MGKTGNNTNIRDKSDAHPKVGQATSQGHTSGRRTRSGSSDTAGGPGAKEKFLNDARGMNKAHTKAFRAGKQDARDGEAGPVSASALQMKTRRRGDGSSVRSPSPSGGM